MFTKTLIIDVRKELPTKYKKLIEDTTNHVDILKELPLALNYIKDNEPDLIIISDSINEELASFCSKIRVLTFNMRPVIVALSKSAEADDRINVLKNGADDFISEPVNSEEFKFRIKAHLRREYENNLDYKTKLPTKKYCMKSLKRALVGEKDWACLITGIENFDQYKSIYTELASDKLLQTYAAIITSTLDENDFIGQYSENKFIIITNSYKADKISSFLSFAFDSVRTKFYSEEDLRRGYTLKRGDEFSGRRCEYVTAITSGITNDAKLLNKPENVLQSLIETYSMIKHSKTSNYLIQRVQLSAQDSIVLRPYNKRVMIVEKDEAMSLLLSTTLNLKGFDTKEIMDTDAMDEFEPAVVVIDVGDSKELLGLEITKSIKEKNEKVKVLVTSIYHDKEMVLNTGADMYLPKPYELTTLTKLVEELIKEYNE